jgi:geranylgeranyl diphosphate synthase type II
MNTTERIERCLGDVVGRTANGCEPPGLAAAVRHAVFPGGARIRPQLAIAVARACGDDRPALADAAACAVELLHCASLVHDDLPCFDNAPLRRGVPSVHAAYGERLAVLAGDALIVLAFDAIGVAGATAPLRLPAIVTTVARSVGLPQGICAGQAWECEPWVALPDYQRAKTGSLFTCATEVGALAAGADPAPWRAFGSLLGEAYQVADDIRDVAAESAEIGKPVGRDRALGRPSAVNDFGLGGALAHFEQLIERTVGAIPDCAGAGPMRALVRQEALRMLPRQVRPVVEPLRAVA